MRGGATRVKKLMIYSNCQVCGKPISYYPSQYRKFCSKGCYFNSSNHKLSLSNGLKTRRGRVKHSSCTTCGKTINARFKYCNRECMFKSDEWREKQALCKRGKPSHKKNHNQIKNLRYWQGKKLSLDHRMKLSKSHWRGGLKELIQHIRTFVDYADWRTSVYKRDNFRCIVCGNNRNLNAHHKIPLHIIFKDFMKQYNQFSVIDDRETMLRLAITHKPFWDIDNGVTLCYDCHRLAHKKGKEYEKANIL